MSTPVEFAVMNGLGNKILVVDMRGRRDKVTPEAAIALNAHADTRFDQIMAIHDPKAEGTDAFIDILNSDGSKAQACGNGTRCVVAGACSRDRQEGIHLPDRRRHPECAGTCRWDHFRRYGHARFCLGQDPLSEEFYDTSRIELQIGPIDDPVLHSPSVMSMGNPHAIFWVDRDVMSFDLERFARCSKTIRCFPSAPISPLRRSPRPRR